MDFKDKIYILDGAMGTMLQRGFSVEDTLKAYIDAGADIISTDSFNANRISLEGLGQGDNAAEMAFNAARTARKVADSACRKILVAGSAGPTGKSLTLASDAYDICFRQYDFNQMADAYRVQIDALVRGGVDLILLETCYDALNAKAAIHAMDMLGNPCPVIISTTVSDRSGRTLTGQTLEAFYTSVRHAPNICAFGINCALGAAAMTSLVSEIASFSDLPLIFYPNAGIPDELGQYNDTPEAMASVMSSLADQGLLNIAGGCCGTTPEHIKAISGALAGKKPRLCPEKSCRLTVSGLESYTFDKSNNFTNIGERTNVAGSRKFARLIAEDNYDEALMVAADQIEGGASIIDINMDDAMLDSPARMRDFIRCINTDPSVAKAAIMIDSSHWETILEGLRNVQGRAIVNSISLKDGEEEFLRRARIIKSMGAAMVVMAFDEEGQAVTFERKTAICERSYKLLTGKAGISPQDIIFDCNILSIGTGIPEHSRFGIDFIDAVRWIKENLPGAMTSGGVSNLSFAFRGNNKVREAMHSAFLYHAVKAGLDMAIVNPQMLQIYDEIDAGLRKCVEDVIFDRDIEATSRLIAKASEMMADSDSGQGQDISSKGSGSAYDRVVSALVKGDESTLAEDVIECLGETKEAVIVIEGPLMKGMELVGDMFADGRMFLPQVVKSAKIMRDAVAVLQPYLGSAGECDGKPKFLIATVQGDVHDIGKNITSIVLQCSGFNVTDLGVMVPSSVLLDKAVEINADIIGVSGLITPSLHRMEEICIEMDRRGMTVPLFIGGAAASAVHTAMKLSKIYSNVHYGADASATAVMAKKYILDPEGFKAVEDELHHRLCNAHSNKVNGDIVACSCCGHTEEPGGFCPGKPFKDISLSTIDFGNLEPFFDWKLFNAICGVKEADEALKSEVSEYLSSEKPSVTLCARFFDCHRENDVIIGEGIRLPMLRDVHSPADFFPSEGSSQMGIFAIRTNGDKSGDLVGHAVRATLAEAGSKYLENIFRESLPENIKLIMPGIGYPCCPDHSLKRDILALLPEELDIKLTDSCAMIPEESICGLVIAHRDAAYHNIRSISSESAEAYARERNFSEEEAGLYLRFISM